MNAYELAEIMTVHDESRIWEHGLEIANMLRQQADRIAELEKQGEPVAWWTGKYEDEGEDFMFPITRQAHIDHPQSETHKFFSIPLYTTPQTKSLSADEIKEAFNQWLMLDEGVARFDYQLKHTWVAEQWERWQKAFKSAEVLK